MVAAVNALIDADIALAKRLDRAESVLKTIGVPTNGLQETHEAARVAYSPDIVLADGTQVDFKVGPSKLGKWSQIKAYLADPGPSS